MSFHFIILAEEKQKSIDIESVCELPTLVLGSQFPSQVNLFVEYLKVSAIFTMLLSLFMMVAENLESATALHLYS